MKAIEMDSERMCGKPCLAGRRLTLEHLMGHLAAGVTVAEYCSDYEVSADLVYAALKEVAEHISDWIINDDS